MQHKAEKQSTVDMILSIKCGEKLGILTVF